MPHGPVIPPPGYATSTRALDHADNAAGLAELEKGFAFTDEMDVWFALGWPHFITLVHDLRIDKKPMAAAIEFLNYTASYVPAKLAHGLARIYQRWPHCMVWSTKHKASVPDKWAQAQLKRKDQVGADEAREMLARDPFPGRRLVLTLEALVGPKVVTESMLDKLESLDESFWIEEYIMGHESLRILQLLLLRLTKKDSDAARKRLERLLRTYVPRLPGKRLPAGAGDRTPLNGLALALHGADAAKRWELGADDFAYLSGSPAWLRKKLSGWTKLKSLHGIVADARRVFLAGKVQMKTEIDLWTKYRGGAPDSDQHVVETYGVVRSSDTVALMVDMLARSTVKGMVKDWFVSHADAARGPLAKLAAGRGALAKPAKLARAILD